MKIVAMKKYGLSGMFKLWDESLNHFVKARIRIFLLPIYGVLVYKTGYTIQDKQKLTTMNRLQVRMIKQTGEIKRH